MAMQSHCVHATFSLQSRQQQQQQQRQQIQLNFSIKDHRLCLTYDAMT